MIVKENVPVWVDESRCKACDVLRELLPSRRARHEALSPKAVLGKMIEVVYADSCIGCRDCELHCPDFASLCGGKGL